MGAFEEALEAELQAATADLKREFERQLDEFFAQLSSVEFVGLASFLDGEDE